MNHRTINRTNPGPNPENARGYFVQNAHSATVAGPFATPALAWAEQDRLDATTYPHTLPIAPATLTPRQRDDARREAGEAFVRALREGVEYETARAVWGERMGELEGRATQG